MQTTISYSTASDPVALDLPEEENGFWYGVAKTLHQADIPCRMEVHTACGNACFSLKKRGTYTENGTQYPSMFVVPEYNGIDLPLLKEYNKKYLVCIHRESNNYKFYEFLPLWGSQEWTAEYGRIGAKHGEMFGKKRLNHPNPSYLFWIRYFEKLSKGYVDQSDLHYAAPAVRKTKSKQAIGTSTVKGQLLTQLSQYAQTAVSTALECPDTVSKKQLSECKKILRALKKRKTVRGFNNQMEKLLLVSPRKTRYVDLMLATKKDQFAEIIEREENLVSAMDGVTTDISSELDDLEVYIATEKQKVDVLSRLSDQLKPKVKQIYRVIPNGQKKLFDAYVGDHQIQHCKKLWHGSRNCNWLSIIKNSLELYPNAQITGKMFGDGIYFAPSSVKSWGYTSSWNAKWNNERSDRAYMALCLCAYGQPLHVSDAITMTKELLGKHNCLHAHAGKALYNDEIVFYDERAILIQYLVEFAV